MKTKIFILSVLSAALFAQNQNLDSNLTNTNTTSFLDVSKFDTMFDVLSKKRVGLSSEQIKDLKNPFLPPKSGNLIDEMEQSDELPHRLTGIIGNRAKINGQWLEVDDSIGSYKVAQINYDSVIISNETNSIELKMNQGIKNVIIMYK